MVNLYGFQLKKIRSFEGMEGYGVLADVYLNNKKVGTYRDSGDGNDSIMQYENKSAKEDVTLALVEFAKKYTPNAFMVNLLSGNNENGKTSYKTAKENLLENCPQLNEKELTVEVVATADIDYLVNEYLTMRDFEKSFNKAVRLGYAAIGVKKERHKYIINMYPETYTDDDIKKDGMDLIFRDKKDFKFQ